MRRILALATLIALASLTTGQALAASLEISPVVVNLAPGQTSATVEVQNRGGAPVAIQARPFTWAQAADDDVLTPTSEIIISPPIFTIPDGASQTLRLLLRGGAQGPGERDYRLLLDEVPPAGSRNKEIVIALRVSMPVIATPARSVPSILTWRAERAPGNLVVLTAANPGRVYATVSAIDVTLADGSHPAIVRRGKNPYVLPGAQRQWIVQGGGAVPGAPLRLSLTTQAGRSDQTLAP